MAGLRVLGPIELHAGGRPIHLGSARQRAILAALAVDVGRPVSVQTLVHRVWEVPPSTGRNAVQVQIARIRKLLDEAATAAGESIRLEHRPAGYLLDIDPDQVDLHRFTRLTERARVAGPAEERAELLHEALGLWRGRALADVPGAWAEQIRQECEQRRIEVVRQWAELELELGRPRQVIISLRELIGEHPLIEPLVALHMRALHADGRTADALDAYASARRRLVDELGVEPGSELRATHQAILRGGPEEPAPSSRPIGVVPAQLPLDVPSFVGRRDELHALDRLLTPAGRLPPAVVISAIAGTAGVGKTALAVRWAHRVAEQFPDGQLYVDLRGYDPEQPLPPGDVLARFLRDLAGPGADIPFELGERSARYRSTLAGRRALVVLDNASTVEQVRPLLPGSPSCFVLVTSRDSLVGLVARDGAHRVDLDILPAADALVLLRELIGGRVDAESAAATALMDRCARLPLALRIAAELAVSRPSSTLAALVDELGREGGQLDFLDAAEDERTSVRAVFSWSYRQLAPNAARLFRLLGLHPGPDFDVYAAAALADADLRQAGRLTDLLARAHLVEPVGTGRFRMHDLLRAYAAERADDVAEARSATTRLLDFYRATAATAMDVLYPAEQHQRPVVPPATTPTPDLTAHLTSPDAARTWLDRERSGLTAATAHAADQGWPVHSVHIALLLWRHLHTGGHHTDALSMHTAALRAARETGDHVAQATILRNLGNIYWQWGRYEQVAEHYQQALVLFREADDQGGEARTLGNLGILYQRWGRYEESIEYHQQALTLFRADGDRVGEARTLDNLGIVHWLQGRYQAATDHHQHALALFRAVDDRVSQAIALGNLGLVYHRRGHYQQAHDHLQQALAIHAETGDRITEADTLDSLGLVYRCWGRYEKATELHQRALVLARETGYRVTEATVFDHLGGVELAQGRHRQAQDCYQQALTLARDIGYREAETSALNGLGETLQAVDDWPAARSAHEAALVLALDTGDRYQQARAYDGIARVLRASGDLLGARQRWQFALAQYLELGVPDADAIRDQLARVGDR